MTVLLLGVYGSPRRRSVGTYGYGFGFELVLELSDDRLRVETHLARVGPKESTCEETLRELPKVLAFNGIQKGCSNLRARLDLSKGQP